MPFRLSCAYVTIMTKPDERHATNGGEPPDADERMQHERKLKHLEFLQTEIRRHASESARLKTSSLAVIVSLLIARELDPSGVGLIAILSTLVHWALDGEAVRKARRFRELYDHVRSPDTTAVDFCMDDSAPAERGRNWKRAVRSHELVGYYFMLMAATPIARSGWS